VSKRELKNFSVERHSIELFAGAGGLSLGFSHAGFKPKAVIEWDKHACDTLRVNRDRSVRDMKDWLILQRDVREIDYSEYAGRIDLVSGGPPCQPFSLGGKHRAFLDPRDMFPETVRAIREVRPRAFVIENVRGLARTAFTKYLQYILLQLSYPMIERRSNEEWLGHLTRLEKALTASKRTDYNVVFRVLNAADYGVPQKRERIIIVGFRHDLGLEWAFPNPTHSATALWREQWITGEYWERHKVAKRRRPPKPTRKAMELEDDGKLPWRTVRDAIGDLPEPRPEGYESISNHLLIPGARSYSGHTGSPIDLPAKALKAGDHGVPGGENMLVDERGRIRYFTVREAARLQMFPDEYLFHGSWSEIMRQLGNAVPVGLAQIVAESVKSCLDPWYAPRATV